MKNQFGTFEALFVALVVLVAFQWVALAGGAMYHFDSTEQLKIENAQLWQRVDHLEAELWETEQARLECGRNWWHTMAALNAVLGGSQ